MNECADECMNVRLVALEGVGVEVTPPPMEGLLTYSGASTEGAEPDASIYFILQFKIDLF